MLENIVEILTEYVNDIKEAECFMKKRYGEVHFLRRKNKGIIPSELNEIKNSPIESYLFHGRVCFFVKEHYTFDVEFDLNSQDLGFTEWTVLKYLKERSIDVSSKEVLIEIALSELRKKLNLRLEDGIYYV